MINHPKTYDSNMVIQIDDYSKTITNDSLSDDIKL